MTTRVAFLRAVNVGKRKVRMPRAVELLSELGFDDVWAYVNSGNLVFDAKGSRSNLEARIERTLGNDLGFEMTTFVRTATELRAALALGPFELDPGDTYFVTFLKSSPSNAVARELEAASNDFDTLAVHGRDVHWRMRGRSTDTKLKPSTWGRLGEHASTSRNVNMLRRLEGKIEGRTAGTRTHQ